ncbi:MAG: 16S rRNA (guanine(966)-N(2))-methyltransferase RsmD [Alphaproteobacteria bacterium]
MRISGGNLRGRRLSVETKGVRPTRVRIREALYDILIHGNHALDLSQTTVLDAFAGTGALGLEALSRGAPSVTFMDTNYAAVTALKDLVAHLGVTHNATILRADATNPPSFQGTPCQLVLLDPPYGSDLALPAIAALDAAGWLDDAPTIVIENPSKTPFSPPEGFVLVDKRSYGTTTLIFLQRDTI